MKKTVLLLLFICNAVVVLAQTGITPLDMNTGAGSSYPLHITPYGTKVACYANDGSKGWELYTTTGTGTPAQIADIYPLGGSCITTFFNQPMAYLAGKLYFTADNGSSGYELFVYDGITLPVIAEDIEIGTGSSSPDNYTVHNGLLYFKARSSTHGYELWKYEPSTNTPTRLTDINTGPDSSLTGGIIAFNNKLYFAADSGSGDIELYEYDPSLNSTNLIADLYPGVLPSDPKHFTVINGKLYFSANDGNHGRELFVYDGTNPPSRITDLAAGLVSSIPNINEPVFASFNGRIYFSGSDTNGIYQLYSLDAGNNTTLVATPNGANNSIPSWLTAYGGKLYFSAYNDSLGFELWTCDSNNTIKLAFEMCKDSGSSQPQQLLPMGDDLYFRANDCMGIGEELFRFNYKTVTVTNIKFDGEAVVYPNPATGNSSLQISLQKNTALRVTITDIHGRIVYDSGTKEYNNGTHIQPLPVEGLSAGSYIYNIYSASGERYTTGRLQKL